MFGFFKSEQRDRAQQRAKLTGEFENISKVRQFCNDREACIVHQLQCLNKDDLNAELNEPKVEGKTARTLAEAFGPYATLEPDRGQPLFTAPFQIFLLLFLVLCAALFGFKEAFL